jgi:hypothetical protein
MLKDEPGTILQRTVFASCCISNISSKHEKNMAYFVKARKFMPKAMPTKFGTTKVPGSGGSFEVNRDILR